MCSILKVSCGWLIPQQIPYIVAEAPSNLVVKYFKPSVWQARVIVSNLTLPGAADLTMVDIVGHSAMRPRRREERRWTIHGSRVAGTLRECACSFGSPDD